MKYKLNNLYNEDHMAAMANIPDKYFNITKDRIKDRLMNQTFFDNKKK